MKYKFFIFAGLLTLLSCDLEIEPFDGITKENLSTVPNTLLYATNGTYSLMKDMLVYRGVSDFRSQYARNLHQMLEYSSDNVTLSGSTTDPLFFAATREHYPSMENATYLWTVAYKIINLVNQNLEAVVEGESAANDHLLGENYFMRANAYFDLMRVFAKPYTHGTENLGVPLRLAASTPDNLERSTVGTCYEQIESDLLKAAELMGKGTNRSVEYASQHAAWALLSRLYLYMENNDKAIEYATKVISSNKFTLQSTDTYLDLFHNTATSKESIFVIKHLLQDDLGTGSIGSMYLTDGIGWGEVYISEPLRNLITQHAEDVRYSLIKPQFKSDGVTVETRNSIPKYFVTKFSYQDGVVTLSSPHVLRLAEMYLNRAEANAKEGNDQAALDDANVIRSRAGILEEDLYTLGDLQGAANVIDAVLQERRMELAYEGHRSVDVYRNKKSMDRNFPGVQAKEVIPFDSPRNIYFIPQDEMFYNKSCLQND